MRVLFSLVIRVYRTTQRLLAVQPLTIRGVLILAFSIIALRVFALPQDDLVAFILGGGMLGLVLLALIATPISWLVLRHRLSVLPLFPEEVPISRTAVRSGLFVRELSLPPFYTLTVRRVFNASGVSAPAHLLLGTHAHKAITDLVVFPHRGVWTVAALRFTIRDTLGFTALTWQVPMSTTVEVSPPTLPIRPLPIVVSSARAGDELQHTRERAGDLYDMKPYDPSDGVTRILWKSFAHSGELFVRRPEPALLPEGEVAVYLVARPEDDHVAGALIDYLEQLQSNQVLMLFGTDGLTGISEQGAPPGFLSNGDEIKAAVNRTVWSHAAGSGSDLSQFLNALEAAGRLVHQVVVFAPEEDQRWWAALSSAAASAQIKLVLAVVPERLAGRRFSKQVSRPLSLLRRRPEPAHVPHVASPHELLYCERSI